MNTSAFSRRYGPWALVTGASSGLGAEFARQLAVDGLSLVLVARRTAPMEALATELKAKHGIEVRVLGADLSREDEIDRLLAAVEDLEIGLLVNNAGFGVTGDFLDAPIERNLELLHLNCRAPVTLSHALGRKMRDRKRGGIVFTASLAAWQAMPGWTLYAASKNWDLMLAEGLHFELKEHGVDVLALCPGATRTEFGDIARASNVFKKNAMNPPEVVAAGLAALGHTTHVVTGWQNKASAALTRLMPRSWAARIAKFLMDKLVKE
jgi:uncharacterized protein